MQKNKEVLCLKRVARGCRISRNTISEYLKRTEEVALSEKITYNPDSTSNKFCHHFHPGGVMVVVERA